MSNNILKLLEEIAKKNNPGLVDSLNQIKNNLMPESEPEPLLEPIKPKIENEKRISLHIVFSENKKMWKVIMAGEEGDLIITKTKKEAISKAKVLAKGFTKSQIIIHKKNGKIQIEYTYGKDPRISKG